MTDVPPNPLQVLIADDEAVARKRLTRLLGAMPELSIAGECEDGREVVARVQAGGIDVLFLDVNMPHLDGLETLALLGDRAPATILCTAHTEHAVVGFEHGVVDYIVKPVEAARLQKALVRVREQRARISERAVRPLAGGGTTPARLALPTRQGIVLIDPQRVSHAVLEGELVTVVTSEGTFLSDATLSELEERLANPCFSRVHRKAIVNLEQIARLEPALSGGFVAHMRGGQTVEVSRQSARELRKWLKLR